MIPNRIANQKQHDRSLGKDARADRRRASRWSRFLPLALAVASSLFLQPAPISAEFKPGRYIEPGPVTNWFGRHVRNGMVKRLGLSESQLTQINEGIDPHRHRLMQEIEVVKDARMRLFENIRAEPYDAAAVGLTFEELRAGELTLMVHAGEIYHDVWNVLTAEQKAEADEIVAEIMTATELRFADFRESFLAGELLGRSTR